MILKNKYKIYIKKILGKGGFGCVYKGKNLENKQKIAIKCDEKIKYNKKEFKIYKLLNEHFNTFDFIDYYETKDKSYLFLPLFNKNCDSLLKKYSFTIKDICMLTIQILQQIHNLHKVNIIHCDIKPDNLLWDINTNKFKLIDFGLSKVFIKDTKHVEKIKSQSRCGTLRYMSINSHEKFTLSRKDDLISLCYTIIYLNRSNLPWKGIKNKYSSKKKIYLKIRNLKKLFNKNLDDYEIPEPLIFLLKYSNNLKFNQKPNYLYLIKVFYLYLKKNDFKYDGKWSWIKK
jgi:serine/threonine protein kinase